MMSVAPSFFADRKYCGKKCAITSLYCRSYSSEIADQVLWDIRYEGYINRQQLQVARQQRMSEKRIPLSFDYLAIRGLRPNEAKQKFSKIRPVNLDQASRIRGITPADIALVLAHLGLRAVELERSEFLVCLSL